MGLGHAINSYRRPSDASERSEAICVIPELPPPRPRELWEVHGDPQPGRIALAVAEEPGEFLNAMTQWECVLTQGHRLIESTAQKLQSRNAWRAQKAHIAA